MNLNGYSNYLKLLINHTVKVILLVVVLISPVVAQQKTDKVNSESKDSVFVMQKSPWGAILRSAVAPGWGQIYNESYYKAPIIWGLSAWLVYSWIQNNKNYNQFADSYLINPNLYNQSNRDFYRDQRDLFSLYIGLTYLLNLVDAYVDAHLFDFTVEDNLLTRYPMIGVRIPF